MGGNTRRWIVLLPDRILWCRKPGVGKLGALRFTRLSSATQSSRSIEITGVSDGLYTSLVLRASAAELHAWSVAVNNAIQNVHLQPNSVATTVVQQQAPRVVYQQPPPPTVIVQQQPTVVVESGYGYGGYGY
eukprot:CAMPEP_0174704388 /NCGR_PEP_ID=MMETSP1094-20130205/8000_1 /TAXON_ID=156173 /ORGANISM="Chrysochromulina brevifilum, Strain UTEX LB 985" /LENGTH=131 /DNA_ID=CAMNT_0015902437 /DNA_START=141 /DNA_END=533 /DNA_ORIENTATION=+